MKTKTNYLRLIISIIICLAAGVVGSIATSPNINTWYSSLAKPAFNPPNWLFAPVWTTLFVLMGISLYFVWNSSSKQKQSTLTYFYIQLFLNIIWSYLFFALHSPFLAFVEIIILWIFILITIIKFYRISKPASILLWPYIIWVSFATFLNYSIYILN